MLYERATGKITDVTPNFDRWVDSMAWSPDSKTIYFTAENDGEAPIYALNITQPNSWPEATLAGFNDSPTPTPDGKMLVFDRMSVAAPNEIYSASLDYRQSDEYMRCQIMPAPGNYQGGCVLAKAKPLTKLNDPILSQIQMQPLESYWFTGALKDKVQGFVVKPPNFDPSKKYPVKYLIHGGPQGAWGDDWSYRWNPELFAANGYVVVMVNFHGSTGYGQKFIDAINGNWGGPPYQDLMLGLDYAEQHYPLHRQGPRVRAGRQLRRIRHQLDRRPHHALQMPGLARRHVQYAVGVRNDRRAVVQRVGVQGHAVDESRALQQVVAAHVRHQLQDADARGARSA